MSSDATTVVLPKQPPRPARRFRAWPVIVALVTILILCMFLWLAAWIAGSISGREFDASSWTFRSFRYIRAPIVHWQLSGVHRNTDFAVDPAIVALVTGGPIDPGAPRWDLVEIYHAANYSMGDAHVLLDYLSAPNGAGNPYWTEWTKQHAAAAPHLWSAVRDCVHLSRYDRLPEIFETARAHSADAARMKTLMRSLMVAIVDQELSRLKQIGDSTGQARAVRLREAYADLPR